MLRKAETRRGGVPLYAAHANEDVAPPGRFSVSKMQRPVLCSAEPAVRLGAFASILCARLWMLAGVLLLAPPLAADSEDCLPCHTGPDAEAAPVDLALLSASVHGALDCLDCHAAAAEVPHPRPLAPSGCADCHPDPAERLGASVHRPAAEGPTRPRCPACHGPPHRVLAAGDPD